KRKHGGCDPDQRQEKRDPGDGQKDNLARPLAALHYRDRAAALSVRRPNDDHHDARRENDRLREPGVHGRDLTWSSPHRPSFPPAVASSLADTGSRAGSLFPT